MIYEAIGRAVVKLGLRYVRRNYGTQVKVGLGLGVAAAAVGAFFALRNPPEG